MTQEFILSMGQQALLTCIYLASPLLGCALLAGLLIGMFQAATQIQDMTLSFVPKLLLLVLVLILCGPWMLDILIRFTLTMFTSALEVTR